MFNFFKRKKHKETFLEPDKIYPIDPIDPKILELVELISYDRLIVKEKSLIFIKGGIIIDLSLEDDSALCSWEMFYSSKPFNILYKGIKIPMKQNERNLIIGKMYEALNELKEMDEEHRRLLLNNIEENTTIVKNIDKFM